MKIVKTDRGYKLIDTDGSTLVAAWTMNTVVRVGVRKYGYQASDLERKWYL